MTLPKSGILTLGDINEELGRSRTAAIQLDKAENGDYGTINTCSPFYPVAGNPAKISEWYGYNHNAVCSYSTKSMLCVQGSGGAGVGNTLIYGGNWSDISTDQPYFNEENGGFTFATWLQVSAENATDYYMVGHLATNASGTPAWSMNIFNIGGAGSTQGDAVLFFNITDGSEGNTFTCVLNSSANTSNTGIATDRGWGKGTALYANPSYSLPLQVGNVNANNFSHLAVCFDAAATGASRFKVYWNGNSLSVSQLSGPNTLSNPSWDQETLWIGGSYPSELSSGLFWDESTYFYENCLTSTEVDEIYNNGAPQNENSYSFSYTNLLYRYENSGALGDEAGGAFNLDQSFGNPTSSTEHA